MPAKKAAKKPKKRRQRQVREPLMHLPSQPPTPTHRLLRGYAFDPTLATRLDTALVSEITYRVRWERLGAQSDEKNPKEIPDVPGPRGEYLEIVDYDPASDCFYAPVNLDDPRVLAQNGVALAEANPQFHQQMVYAVAMTTIDRFEQALGRKALWADSQGRFVQRLRIYPHALRHANAYYSPVKVALLFGYFPTPTGSVNGQVAPGMVFTCLSHDIIAHETTHALLHGMHKNTLDHPDGDALAFHEAFADIVALFQHFSFAEVLRHQIALTKGELKERENLLAQIATQFGQAQGMHGALRDAIGKFNRAIGKWEPHRPDPTDMERAKGVHEKGAVLVAAVFEAFLSIYRGRTRDLLRIATDGTGVLREGELHPDLVNRLAEQASKSATHVLNMCIRALDYCPPVGLTFGEYLRAIITADMDLMPMDSHYYRVAFIEAFRRRGIYPENLRTLGEDTLRWGRPEEELNVDDIRVKKVLSTFVKQVWVAQSPKWALRRRKTRKEIWEVAKVIRADVHKAVMEFLKNRTHERMFRKVARIESEGRREVDCKPKMWVTAGAIEVESVRLSRREGDHGRVLNQLFLTLLQTQTLEVEGGGPKVDTASGCVFVIDLDDEEVRYVIRKGVPKNPDDLKHLQALREDACHVALAATYFGGREETFAMLHGLGA